MRTDDFDFELPPDLIAQEPPARREDARLMVVSRATGAVEHRRVPDLAGLLHSGDLLVVNDTKVLRARLFVRRATGGRVEVFLLEPRPAEGPTAWEALVRAGGSVAPGEVMEVIDDEHEAGASRPGVRLERRVGGGHWIVSPAGGTFDALMDRAGRMPLPPYIRRAATDPRDASDVERYQTVYAREPGAVAAPTAGLHLTEGLLETLRERGVQVARVTLHVGLGTFKPIATDTITDHVMHEEAYVIPEATAAAVRAVRAARAAGDLSARVVAVGTTSVRALESAAAASPDGLPAAGPGRTSIFITPGYTFRAVDALLTNFHLPRSTLLCLVSAFAKREHVLAAYRSAVAERYRFFSYGDAMLLS
ncbi:MAG: tRNA preQ1(34) S-adenosylmethionine ribosyltransferase-isomerase QueA [Planctomycetes bacterium]|nr:tRNA preQ1(34) S-adenosylmethionine ribosyltransferase-isomerase QueA [Planctomycetota bacterium]